MRPIFPRALRWRRSLPALLALVLLPALLLAPGLFGDRSLAGLHTDSLSPWRSELSPEQLDAVREGGLGLAADKPLAFEPALAESLRRLGDGEAPLWNPNNLLGVPLLAQGFPSALHPSSWLLALLGPARSWAWMSLLHAAMAGIFMYLLGRELGGSVRGAFVGGVAFMLGGYLASRWHWYQIQAAGAYLPLALLGAERLLRGGRGGSILTLALATGLAFLTGWFQGALHMVYVVAAWSLVRALPMWTAGGRESALATGAIFRVGVATLLGLMLGAAQLLPAVEYVESGDSTRAHVAPEVLQEFGLHPHSLLTTFVPDLYGHPRDLAKHPVEALRVNGALRRLFAKASSNPVESSAFLGVGVVVLALCGAGSGRRGRRRALALMLLGALLALDTPLLQLVTRLPGLDTGDPRRFLLIMQLGAALLAAQGAQVLGTLGPPTWVPKATATAAVAFALLTLGVGRISTETWVAFVDAPLAEQTGVSTAAVAAVGEELRFDLELLQRSLARVTAALVVVWIALRYALKWPAAGAWLLLMLVVLELGWSAWRNAGTVPAEGLFRPPPDLAVLQDLDGGRFVRFHPGGSADVLNAPLPPNLALSSGLNDLGGYWPLGPRRALTVMELLEPGSTREAGQAALSREASLDSPLLDVLGVSRVLSSVPLEGHRLVPRGRVGNAFWYGRANAMPRAWFARTLPVANAEEALARLADPDFDPTDGVLIEPLDGVPAFPLLQPLNFPHWSEVPVTIVEEREESLRLRVDAPNPGLVVLADGYVHGWSAQVDGLDEPIWAANHALRAVAVDAGVHEVRMSYASAGWELGKWLSASALLLLALIGVRRWRQVLRG